MKATDIWKIGQKPTVSFELFPPKSAKAAEKFDQTIDELLALNPDFVSITFGAGGSTREGSHQLIEKLRNEKDQEVIAYFAGYGLGPEDITSVLDGYQALGLENILVVRGDKPANQEDFKPLPVSMKEPEFPSLTEKACGDFGAVGCAVVVLFVLAGSGDLAQSS